MAAAVFVVADRHRQMNNNCSSPGHSVKTPSLKSKLSGIHFGWKEGRASTSTADTAESSMRSGSSEDSEEYAKGVKFGIS
ncbi:hypothetical protein Tdes44962_MAKER03568 [Teratosphaeria destructans]|uniref:Uncharacterized protein n=1 Tax=Teratosphaeria destructans TaxID=418781 RepID=A0A9W7SPN2_9PEZI|nr:hypothetical protein Tdes44962_MAKER03568 [Teratosphaeria destructans]